MIYNYDHILCIFVGVFRLVVSRHQWESWWKQSTLQPFDRRQQHVRSQQHSNDLHDGDWNVVLRTQVGKTHITAYEVQRCNQVWDVTQKLLFCEIGITKCIFCTNVWERFWQKSQHKLFVKLFPYPRSFKKILVSCPCAH